MTSNIYLSIIMPVLNEERRIKRALDSIAREKGVPYEVIVIDNGCTDRTVDIASSYPFVRVIKYFGSLGGAYQVGLMHARGRYVMFMAADEYLIPGSLKKLMRLINKYPGCDAMIARILPLCSVRSEFCKYIKAYFYGDTMPTSPWHNITFHSGGLIVKTNIARKVMFNPRMPISEDGDFSYRFLRMGYRACYVRSHIIIEETFNSLRAFLSYYKKLGMAGLTLFKTYPNLNMFKYQLKGILEPFTPHYLIIRYRRVRRYFNNYLMWILLGVIRAISMMLPWLTHGLLGIKISRKIIRTKIL